MEAAEQFDRVRQQIGEQVEPRIVEATKDFAAMNHQVANYIKANPAKSLLSAVALGYVIGRIAKGK